jgi:hypothetical protein
MPSRRWRLQVLTGVLDEVVGIDVRRSRAPDVLGELRCQAVGEEAAERRHGEASAHGAKERQRRSRYPRSAGSTAFWVATT